MPVTIVLSVSIVVAIVAVTVLIGVRLVRTAGHLTHEATASMERLRPLTDELGEELAVTQTELDSLQERTRRLRSGREG